MNSTSDTFRAGIVAIVGAPNAGKSTFLNRVLGQKIAITSHKPQTTRDKIAGILTDERSQIVFLDTPGAVEPEDLLHTALAARVREALDGVDGVIHLRDSLAPLSADEPAAKALAGIQAPILEVWNKLDLLTAVNRANLLAEISRAPAGTVFAISALTGEGIPALLSTLSSFMPEGHALYPPDDVSDRDMRFLAAEIVREKVFEFTHQEAPYSTATRTEEFTEREAEKHHVLIHIFVERESQKGILIGRGGEMLRRIGEAARTDIEALLDHGVFLELRVKTLKNWTKSATELRRLGYDLPRGTAGRNARGSGGGRRR